MLRYYIAFYKNRRWELQAESSYAAQREAAKYFGARKAYDVTVMLGDCEHSTGAL
jgi:hypothetical protein